MPAHSHRKAGLTLAGAVILAAALAGCSGNAATPAYTGPAPTVAQSGQVFTSPQLDITLTPVSGAAGLTVPDNNGGLTVTVSKTGQPQLVTQGGANYMPGDGLGFVAVEVAAAQQPTPYPTWKTGNTQSADAIAQFLIDNAPVGQPVSLPYAGATASWAITAPTASQVVLQITSGAVVQTLDARTGQPVQAKSGAAAKGVTFAGEDAPAQTITATTATNYSWDKPYTGTLSMSFSAGTAYLTSYVDGAGWAPEGQTWLMIDFQNSVKGTPQCGEHYTCDTFLNAGVKATTFTMNTTSGQTLQPFGTTPAGDATQLLYQVAASSTGFNLVVDSPVDINKAKQGTGEFSYTFTPAQLDFTHTYTLTFQ